MEHEAALLAHFPVCLTVKGSMVGLAVEGHDEKAPDKAGACAELAAAVSFEQLG